MKTIAHKINDKVVITYITNDMSVEEYCLKFLNGDKNYIELSETNSLDMFFGDALELENKQIVVNIQRAKKIWIEEFRKARKQLLVALDIEFMRAVESGDATLQGEIASKKQALREVTTVKLPDTLEGIKSTWPNILGPKPF